MASSSVEPQAQAAIDSADKLRWETNLRRAKVLAKLGIKLKPQANAIPQELKAKLGIKLPQSRHGKLWQLDVDEHKVLAKKYAIQEEISLVQQKLAEVQEQKALVRLMLSEAEQEQQELLEHLAPDSDE